MADREPLPVPEDPRDWAPMRPYQGRRKFDIVDAVAEPLWSGVRVLVHFRSTPEAGPSTEVLLIEEFGVDLSEELPAVADAIARGVMANDAIIDGVISQQVGLDGVGAAAISEVRASTAGLLMRNNADLDVVPRGAIKDDPATIVPLEGFIAVDLLRVDGTSLLDVPLLERKRILESVIEESELLRVSAHVRPPISTWIGTWKAMGLRGGILKAANSRYHPGDDSIEWRLVERVGRH